MHQYAKDGFHVAAAPEICAAFYQFYLVSFYIASSQGQGIILPRYVDFSEGKNQSTWRKTLEAPDRSTMGTQLKIPGVAIFHGPQEFYMWFVLYCT